MLRRPKNLDLARAQGLSKEACDKFYRFLTTVYEEGKYPPCRIWNADESGLSAGQTNSSIKVIGIKGSKNVMTTNNNDREWMTILVCVNAMGYSILNLYIFKSKGRKRNDYIEQCEPNAKMTFQEKGWINEKIFCEWLDHFRDHVPGGVSLERKHLLLLDGHASHINYNVVNKATTYGIDIGIITFPYDTHDATVGCVHFQIF
jgi:hypothetical protein